MILDNRNVIMVILEEFYVCVVLLEVLIFLCIFLFNMGLLFKFFMGMFSCKRVK